MNHPISRVDQFLTEAAKKPSVSRGSLIFGLDATGSRERSWDTASHVQVEMFREVAIFGALDLQLVYFRGTANANAECKSSTWVDNPIQLATFMARIKCEAGLTQIAKVLTHALREASVRRINAMVFVGDACEETRDKVMGPARELGRLNVPIFMFQEGNDREAEVIFREIAEISGGACQRFDAGSAGQLGELLRAVAAFAVGGMVALEKQGSAAAKLLLGQVR